MRRTCWELGRAALIGALFTMTLAACPTSTDAPCSGAACITDGDTDGGPTSDGGGGDVVAPPGCNLAADLKDAPACIDDSVAVFVDGTTGNDANDGAKRSPFKTIGAAVAKRGNKPRVYVCAGTYDERVAVTSSVSIYGGLACGAWTYDGSKPKIAPRERGFAVRIAGASQTVTISDLEVITPDAVEPGESSIAMFVSQSVDVRLRRVVLTAGKAQAGQDAPDLPDFMPRTAPAGTDGVNGGAATPNPDCTTSIGGAAGTNGAPAGGNGREPVAQPFPDGNTGAGGAGGAACGAGGVGLDGSYGAAGAPGSGAAGLGALDTSGWKGMPGSPGGRGGHGQGGGGGAQRFANGVGGGGGAGGCGGLGGGGGGAGGSSVALLVHESVIAIEASQLTAAAAGNGGKGGRGQTAQLAQTSPAAANNGSLACVGGIGGIGGSGGGGGGGAGGLSVGVLYKGSAPRIDGAEVSTADTQPTIRIGSAGARGMNGAGGIAAQLNAPVSRAGVDGIDGIPGQAKAVMSAP